MAQRMVGALGQVRLRVLPLGLLLLLLEAGQAEEEAEDGFQITIPDLCVSGRTVEIIIIARIIIGKKVHTHLDKLALKAFQISLKGFGQFGSMFFIVNCDVVVDCTCPCPGKAEITPF